MASAEDIATLRRMINEPSTATYSDVVLGALIDEKGLDATAAQVWSEKAAAASVLVNTSESGSSRSLQQIHSNALAMANFYGGRVTQEVAATDAPMVIDIERA